ncbi:MAG: penicillin acylase family protein [Vicinamibacterales bacterium]
MSPVRTRLATTVAMALTLFAGGGTPRAQATDAIRAQAQAALPQTTGTIALPGLARAVEVIRDRWGIPHIYAGNTHDLFFAQGFTVAQDRLWQLEMWRRNAEGRLSEVLGPGYVTRDRFARLLAFRGDWDVEFRKYHPEGRVIFDAFAEGVNAAIRKALADGTVPVEFRLMGFDPQPVWTAKTLLTRMPGWTLSRNVSREVQRAIDVLTMGLAKTRELAPTDPATDFVVPDGLDLQDITPDVLGLARGANDIRWSFSGPSGSPGSPGARGSGDYTAGFGSNNWVIAGARSATGKPLIANDPHREVVNPALRYMVHLNAPGWNALGATEPGLPGISIGHNDRVAWGFTILGIDQQDLYVEETNPDDADEYRWKGAWAPMRVERELIWVKGQAAPVEVDLKFTRHGPVIAEHAGQHRAFALRWVGAEPGGAGYLGSLNVMQARNLDEFRAGVAKSWYLPSHSLVYADVEGNTAYLGAGLTPRREGWDGLMPVPGKDGRYEWDGFVPAAAMPFSANDPRGFYNTSNNDVVPEILPDYALPLGYEYSAPFRYERAREVLADGRRLTVADMARLQQDTLSLPARALVPLLTPIRARLGGGVSLSPGALPTSPFTGRNSTIFAARVGRKDGDVAPEVVKAIDALLGWDYRLDASSNEALLYEFWMMKLQPKAYEPRLTDYARRTFRAWDVRRVVEWMTDPGPAYGVDRKAREQARDGILLSALVEAVEEIEQRYGGSRLFDMTWGDIHTADFVHPLAQADGAGDLFAVAPVPRGGDAYTLLASTSLSAANTKQLSGASFAFVFDVADWDRSVGLSAPGQSAQPLSPHYKDLAGPWGRGDYFPLIFSRAAVEQGARSRLTLEPQAAPPADGAAPPFVPLQPETFAAAGAQATAFADYDGDGDLDYFVGFRGALDRLYRNDDGRFTDVAPAVGLGDANETRAAAWGDYDGDGDLDLFVGFASGQTVPDRLYRNDGGHFTDVAREAGIDLHGTTRQPVWLDYDEDGDLDLFVAFRDRPNVLLRNDHGHFTDVAPEVGLADGRKAVSAVWFDMDQDGDLDLFVANQEGEANGLFRNDAGRFTDVADEAGVSARGRAAEDGGVGPAVADYDLDGDLDLFVANYGANALYRNDGHGRFTDVAEASGISGHAHDVTAAWGDYDNDGDPDLYVAGFLGTEPHAPDLLYRNDNGRFTDVIPAGVKGNDASHGVQWADVDGDGALDLALANNDALGHHPIFRNALPPADARRSVSVVVRDPVTGLSVAGAEVRAYAAGTRTLVAAGLVDAGSGYCSQSVQPVHLGLPSMAPVDIEVTLPRAGRPVMTARGVMPGQTARPGMPQAARMLGEGRDRQAGKR